MLLIKIVPTWFEASAPVPLEAERGSRNSEAVSPPVTAPGHVTSLASWLKGAMAVGTQALRPCGLRVPGGPQPCPAFHETHVWVRASEW